jgi:endoglucanase
VRSAFTRSPVHPFTDVSLAWMRDFLELWQEAGWGWALWNLRGAFGVLDSGRTDVAYQPYRGHQLDQKMLELLRDH